MTLLSSPRRLVAIAGAALFLAAAAPAGAQEIADTHMAAARSALTAMKATEEFDVILPRAAQGLKNQLIAQNPNLQQVISTVVDQKAIAMAARRGDLEREAALAYARVFSEEELTAIANFYGSPAGAKLIEGGPIVARELYKAADIWQRGMSRDLSEEVAKELFAQVGDEVQGTGVAPDAGAVPTPAVPGVPAAPVAPAN